MTPAQLKYFMLMLGIAQDGRRFITVGRETMCKSSPEHQF